MNILKHKGISMKRPAFTMIELVFVIVVIGILAAVALPRIDRDIRQEAANSLLSDIRYTQHLALVDDKHKFDNAKWQQRFWRIVFSTCTGSDRFYMIGTDDDMESASNAFFDKEEAAIDPSNGKPMFWTNGTDCSDGGDGNVSERIFVTRRYGINSIGASGGCGTGMGHIGFDQLGRPHYGFSTSTSPDYSTIMTSDCNLTFNFVDTSIDPLIITIKKETGFAYIVDQEGS